jgi:hypothetical protein
VAFALADEQGGYEGVLSFGAPPRAPLSDEQRQWVERQLQGKRG